MPDVLGSIEEIVETEWRKFLGSFGNIEANIWKCL